MNGNRNRVLLLYPAGEPGQLSLIPLSLLYVAQPLIEEGIDVELIDQRLEKDFFKRVHERIASGLICIGISCTTGPQIEQVIRISKFIKKETNTPIVLGGPHPTLFPVQTLESPFIDYVVVGRGEAVFLNLVEALKRNASAVGLLNVGYKENGRVVIKKGSVSEHRVRRIPYHLASRYGRPSSVPILSSYGCPYHCTFCVERVLHPAYFEIPLSEVLRMVEEALLLKPKFINFFDDNFLLNKKRVLDLLSLCRNRGLDFRWICTGRADAVLNLGEETLFLKQRGLLAVYFGIESGSPRILKLINKGIAPETVLKLNSKLREEGIIPHYSFMAGFPTETEEDFQETIRLMNRLKQENSRAVIWKINKYTPYPGTELFDLAVQNGFKPPERFEEWSHLHFYSEEYQVPYDVQL